MGKINKKTIISIVSIIVLVIVVNIGYEKYQEYARKKELQDKIEYLQTEINKINSGDYSSVSSLSSSSSDIGSLYIDKFSANSDGTFVKAYVSIKNISTVAVDEIIDIAYFDENGNVIDVNPESVKLNAGETMYVEDLIGLTKDGTVVPVSAELSN